VPEALEFIVVLGHSLLAWVGAVMTIVSLLWGELTAEKFVGGRRGVFLLGVVLLIVSAGSVYRDVRLEARANADAQRRLDELEHAGIRELVRARNEDRARAPVQAGDTKQGDPPARSNQPTTSPRASNPTTRPPAPAAPHPTPGAGDGLTLSAARSNSDRQQLPYAVTVRVNVRSTKAPFGVLLHASAPLDDAEFVIPGENVYDRAQQGALRSDPSQYYVGFASPTMTPDKPLIVTLFAKAPFEVLRVDPVYLHPDQ
jgi:hypothetical protein